MAIPRWWPGAIAGLDCAGRKVFAVGLLTLLFVLFVAGILVVLMFAYAFSWIFATVGLWIGDPESAQAAALMRRQECFESKKSAKACE